MYMYIYTVCLYVHVHIYCISICTCLPVCQDTVASLGVHIHVSIYLSIRSASSYQCGFRGALRGGGGARGAAPVLSPSVLPPPTSTHELPPLLPEEILPPLADIRNNVRSYYILADHITSDHIITSQHHTISHDTTSRHRHKYV